MACPECEKNKKKTAKDFTKAVVEIKNPDKLVLFRKVVVPASMGTEEQFPASVGKFSNVLLQYEANGDTYLYSSDGIPTQLSSDVSELQRQLDELKIVVTNEIADRIAADGTINSRIDQEILDRQAADNGLSDALAAEVAARKAADNTLDGKITTEKNARIAADNTLQTNINNEATARAAADSTLDGKITTEKEAREAADQTLQTNINNEATTRANADAALGTRITNETTARQNADNALDGRITTEANTRSAADSALAEDISAEVTRAKAAETALGGRIDDEATARAAADTTLDGKIAAEATARANADSTLDGRITDEATARANADTALGTRITDETTARTNADTAINNKLNRTVLYDLEMQTDANNVTFVEDKVNLGTGATTTERDVIPAASATTAGTISASEYISLVDAEEKITALLEGAVAIDNLPANPTQQQLTNAWLAATGKDELINRASIYDSANQLVHTYYTNVSEWEDSPAGGQITIDQFTNSAAGIIKGSTTDGNVSANLDGTGTVSGWTALKNTVAGKANSSDLATVATSGSYNDLSNKPTIPTVNNATLTIQKNGTTVNTFTANASTNVTANITVPTKTSDLTNDSNFPVDANYVHTDNNFTTTLKNKLDGIAAGAEVNQNAFSNVKVGGTTVAADSKTDTLELVAGSNVTLTPDATNDKVTIAATVPTKTSDLTNDSGYITNAVNNLVNYTTTTDMDTALDGKVNIQSISLESKTTTILNEVKALQHSKTGYARFSTSTDGGAANISDKPVSGMGFVCVAYRARYSSNSDYEYQLWCYVHGQNRPFFSRITSASASIVWGQLSIAAFSGSYNDLTNKPAINNGTLTIQKNGTNVQTFTANQSTNATANITVPTKVTDLTDAANYVAKDGDFHVTGEGSNFSMTGTSQNVYADLKVKGDTQQNVYTGKNLLNIANGTYSDNGVTAVVLDGKITMNGTASGGTSFIQIPFNFTASVNDTYTLSANNTSTIGTNSNYAEIRMGYSPYTLEAKFNTTNSSITQTFTQSFQTDKFLIRTATDLSYSDFVIYPQLEKASSATPFEPYVGGVPAPNPDYPQEVEVVKNGQKITSCGKNMFRLISGSDGGLKTTFDPITGGVNVTGTATKAWPWLGQWTPLPRKIPAGTTVTVSSATMPDRTYAIRFYTDANNHPDDFSLYNGRQSQTKTLTNDIVAIGVLINCSSNEVVNIQNRQFQIEIGDTATKFEPLIGKNIDLMLVSGKNLLDVSGLGSGTQSGITWSVGSDGVITVTGTATTSVHIRMPYYLPQYLLGKQVSLSATGTWGGLSDCGIKDVNTSLTITLQSSVQSVTRTVTQEMIDKADNLDIWINSGVTVNAAVKLQFEVGAVTSWELCSPIELCKIGTYQDYIYPSGGKWWLHKETASVDFGTLTWTTSTGTIVGTTGCTGIKYAPNNATVIPSYAEKYIGRQGSGLSNYTNYYAIDTNKVNVQKGSAGAPNPTGMFYYPLATATDTEITNPLLVAQLDDLWRNLQSGTNTTNVNVEGDLPAILGVTAFTNTLASAMAGINERMNRLPAIPQITMTTTDPGEGQTLADNHYIAVFEA